MSMPQELNSDAFKSFLGGRIKDSEFGVGHVLTILDIIDGPIFFEPGFSPMLRTMMQELGKDVSNIEYAGRLAQLNLPSRRIEITDGGLSIGEYWTTQVKREKVIYKLNALLDQLKDKRRVVTSAY